LIIIYLKQVDRNRFLISYSSELGVKSALYVQKQLSLFYGVDIGIQRKPIVLVKLE